MFQLLALFSFLSLLVQIYLELFLLFIFLMYSLLCGSARMLIRYYVSLILDKDNESVLIYGAGNQWAAVGSAT